MFGMAIFSGAVGLLASIPSQGSTGAADPTSWISQPIGIGTIVLVVVGFLTKQIVPGWVYQQALADCEHHRKNYELEREARLLEQRNAATALGGATTLDEFISALRSVAGVDGST